MPVITDQQRRLILTTTSIGAFLTPFTSTILSFIIPVLGRTFHASLYLLVYVPIVFLIPLASLMVLLGRLADLRGRVLFFRIGFILYLVGSLIGYLAPNVYVLIVSSLIMGLGSSILSPGTAAIVSQVYPTRRRGFALGINAMAVYLGLTSAPFVGGLITEFLGWRANLLISFVMALLGLLISLFSMRNVEFRLGHVGIDYLGSATFTTALVAVTTYLILGNIYGWVHLIYLLIIGLLSLALFVYIEDRVTNPMLDLSMFTKNIMFAAGNITALLNYISTFSIPFLFSLYLQSLLGFSPFMAGLVLVAEPVFMAALSPFSGSLSDRYSPRVIAALGMGIIGVALTLLAVLNTHQLINIVIPLSILGIGFGLFSAPNTNSVMGSVPPDRYGIASGVLGTMRFTGQLLSITLASSVLIHYIGAYASLYLFTGVLPSSVAVTGDFMMGLRITLAISAVLSFIGVYTSLLTR
ncbi:MFS transporter [Vulcanisaeta thermophila]|uniref:MFS transporter n=1 Tax=Vulcanisaeta thermophila TaxID=867917 RepID=UPI00085380F2|nr:MFS transporter [Vulcanisaeta thermophila]